MTTSKHPDKMKIKRCQRCKKKEMLTEISSEPQQINAFIIRSYVGIQCECGWSDKTYTFKDVEEGKG